MQALAIILLCMTASIAYGILHDQITVRVCVEYFTIGHPPVFVGLENPMLLGLAWGILATWWVGLILGVLLAYSARAGSLPKQEVKTLVRPVLILLAIMAIGALLAGVIGWVLGGHGSVYLLEPFATLVPKEKHAAFLAALWAHNASYFFGFVGGAVVIYRVRRLRREQAESMNFKPDFARP